MTQGVLRGLRSKRSIAGALFIVACLLLIGPPVSAHEGGDAPDFSSDSFISENLGSGPIAYQPPQPESFTPLPYFQPVGQSIDCAVEKCLALTFDDGPDSTTTPQVLADLDGVHAMATFFIIGKKVATHVDLLKRMQASGYEIGDHSWSHPDFTRLTPLQIRDQINSTQQAIIAAGLPAPRFFRPPYESRNDMIRRIVNMPFILWNVDPKDWNAQNPHLLAQTVIATAKPGAIIIMHDTLPVTVQALPEILVGLKDYRLVSVSQLLNLSPTAQGEFTGR